MSRRSSRTPDGSAPPLTEKAVVRAPEYLGFDPTPGMVKVKSAFWATWKNDPLVDPEHLTVQEIAQKVDAPSLEKWWKDPSFRAWFLNKETWREELEFGFHLWMSDAVSRIHKKTLADKDFINLGKLLAEMADRFPRTSAKGEKSGAPVLTDEQARKLFEQTALSLGWVPPAPALDVSTTETVPAPKE